MTKATETGDARSIDRGTPGLKLPLVSVVVTCYNHSDFLRACLDSVAGQTYPHLQVIVVDNVSTDNSRDVMAAFGADLPRADLAYETVYSAVNGHETGAMVQGFARTKGSYVCFIDGDDLLLPGCIETHIKAHLVSRIAVGLTSVDMYQSSGDDIVVGTGKLVSQFVMSRRGQRQDFCRMANLDVFDFPEGSAELSPGDLHYVPPAMANEWVWSPSTGLCFRREAAELMLDPPPKLRAGADNYMVRGITCLTGGISIDRPLAVYRLHGSNMFTRHPALASIHEFDPTQRGSLDLDVAHALLDRFKERIPYLAQRLDDPELFPKAIDHLAGFAPGLDDETRFSRPSLGFLVDNREAIVRGFGAARYRKWVVRRLRPSDVVKLIGARSSAS